MAGRKPVPTHLKIVRGNPGKRPLNKAEPTPSGDRPEPPAWLSGVATEHFHVLLARVEETGLASATYTEAIALAAMRMEEISELTEVIGREGWTYETTTAAGDTMVRPRPEVAQRSEAARHLQSLLAEFGLTASSASKVTVPGKGKPENKFAALAKKG